eukprot:2789345-Pyramimonas_sp.AAC.1
MSYNGGFADICHLPFVKSHGVVPFAFKCKLKAPISHKLKSIEYTIGFDLFDIIADAGLYYSLRTKG